MSSRLAGPGSQVIHVGIIQVTGWRRGLLDARAYSMFCRAGSALSCFELKAYTAASIRTNHNNMIWLFAAYEGIGLLTGCLQTDAKKNAAVYQTVGSSIQGIQMYR